jgi:RimJ/RimL family protein N-acetyltransferase
MLITSLPRCITHRDLTLRHLRISDGPFLSGIMEREDILKSSGVCKTRQSSGVCRPRRTPWIIFYWWLRKTFFVAYCIERKAHTIGFIGLSNLVPGESAEISLVLFDPVSRRKGYGTRAFTLLSQHPFTTAFANTFIVRVRKDNESARSFWTKLGFETVGGDGDTIMMELRGGK